MPNIHAEMIHLPGFKPPKGPGWTARAGKKAKQTFAGPTRFARHRIYNATSTNAVKDPTKRDPEAVANSAAYGAYGALAGASVVGVPATLRRSSENDKIRRNQQRIAANKRQIKRSVSKARVPRITMLGTSAARNEARQAGPWPLLHGPALGIGAGLGAGTFVAANNAQKKHNKKVLATQKKTLAAQRAQLAKSANVSAFGVEH